LTHFIDPLVTGFEAAVADFLDAQGIVTKEKEQAAAAMNRESRTFRLKTHGFCTSFPVIAYFAAS
jgi:hypothetical protein